MFSQIRLTLSCDGGFVPPRNIAYTLYSALCEKLPPDVADVFHGQSLTPLSAYTRYDERAGSLYWTVTAFGEAGRETLRVLERETQYALSSLGKSLAVTGADVLKTVTEADFCREYLVDKEPKRELRLRFLTPCAFKSEGEYVIMPTKSLLIKSCAQRWNAFSEQFKLDDEVALADIIDRCKITRDRLASTVYPLKGVNIPSFTGELTLSARGPEPLLRLVNLLAAFAEYSGVGIKTALGMGGCAVEV
jgi:hypothetical protein